MLLYPLEAVTKQQQMNERLRERTLDGIVTRKQMSKIPRRIV